MKVWAHEQRGFTIVELLIVVVVIAILAAISIVAYTGIQNRANDSAVQNDINNFAKKVHLIAAETDSFPAGGAVRVGGVSTGDSTNMPGFTFTPTKGAYMTTNNNLYYCTGVETTSGQRIFRIAARSKSGNAFQYSSNGGIQNLGNTAVSISVCQGMNDPHTWAYGHYYNSGTSTWWSWTN